MLTFRKVRSTFSELRERVECECNLPGKDGHRGLHAGMIVPLNFTDRSHRSTVIQPRLSNGQFNYTDPRHCSVHDPTSSTCFLNAQRHDGFYEGSPITVSLKTMSIGIALIMFI